MKTNNRRKFLEDTFKLSIGAAVLPMLKPFDVFADETPKTKTEKKNTLAFAQVPLTYGYNGLEPYIDAKTMEIHYTKHHAAYVKNVNEAIVAEHLNFKNEGEFFAQASSLSAKARNNGGGAWNHNFFWESMKGGGAAAPSGLLKQAIDKSFGSFDQFKDQFSQAAMGRFGSGWAWLISDQNKNLKITSTPNQDNPLMDDVPVKGLPLLGLDVWEHAYYLKYQNKRNEYVAGWWNVVNWDAVSKRFV